MTDDIQPIISDPFDSVDDVLDGLADLEQVFRTRRDDRAVFATAYRRMTLGLKIRLDGDFFADSDWVRKYLVAFGEDYRLALHGWERGELDDIPDAWTLSFEAAEQNEALVLQDLVLGVNAHINHDLPFALASSGLEDQRARKYEDHNRVNDVIGSVLDAVQNRIVEYYSRGLGYLDTLLGPVDETVTQFSLSKAREHAWSRGLALSNASNPDERRRLHAQIDDTTETLARIVLAPTELPPFVSDALEFIDDDQWWFDDVAEELPPTDSIVTSSD